MGGGERVIIDGGKWGEGWSPIIGEGGLVTGRVRWGRGMNGFDNSTYNGS